MSAVGESPADPAESRKRRGSPCDTSGQSLEKRRRELECRYIEDLAELLSSNMADIASLSSKPDQSHILRSAVDQIQQIKRREQEKAALGSPGDAVQKSDVSSSSQGLLEKEALGPMLLEALDGFFFVVNGEGRLVFVSHKVSSYLGYAQEELTASSVYSILHVGDHGQFVRSLLPRSLVNGGAWPQGAWPQEAGRRNSHTFSCRLLRRPPDEADSENQEARQQYEVMQCFTVSRRREEEGDDLQSCLICIACRTPRTPPAVSTESFITKQDPTGKIVSIETSALRASGRPGWEDVVRKCIYAFFQPQGKEPSLAKRLLHQVMTHGTAISPLYRFTLTDGTPLSAQTRCKFCCPPNPDVQPFIMGIHTIDREHNTASSQENTNPSLPPPFGAPAPPRSPSLPPSAASSQGRSPAASGPHPHNSNASSHGHNPATPAGYLTPTRTNPPQGGGSPAPLGGGSPAPLGSPPAAAPTSFMSPRVPRASPGSAGNPLPPPTPGRGGGEGAGGAPGAFPLSSPAPQRQASTPKPPGGGGGGGDSVTAPPPAASHRLNQLLGGGGAEPNNNSNNNNNGGGARRASSPRPPHHPAPPQCPASHSSLTERHKILHRLLQDTSPAPAPPAEDAGERGEVEIKKEPPASPAPKPGSREPQDHQLLRFLLDTDEKDLGDLPPPSALSLQTVRVKVEKRSSLDGVCTAARTPAGDLLSPRSSPMGDSRDSISGGPADPDPLSQLLQDPPGAAPQDPAPRDPAPQDPARLQSPSQQLQQEASAPPINVKREPPGTPSRGLEGGPPSGSLDFCSPPTPSPQQGQGDPLHPPTEGSPFPEAQVLDPFSPSTGLPKMEAGQLQPLALLDSFQPQQGAAASPPEQCVPCSLDEALAPPPAPPPPAEGRGDEKALLEQLISFLSGTDERELAALDRALGIDKLLQGGCFDPPPPPCPPQQPTATPVPPDPKLPPYPPHFTPAAAPPQAQFSPELAAAGPQGLGFGGPRGAFSGGLRPQGGGATGAALRLPPNQLRLQLQQRLQGPQQLQSRLAAVSPFSGAAPGVRPGGPQPPMPSQPPLNAQMLAQRQRELYSIQHRQRQLFQQKVLFMRHNMAAAAPPPPAAAAAKGALAPPQQQFSFPGGFSAAMTGNPPTSAGPFSPPDAKLAPRVPLSGPVLGGHTGLFQQFGGAAPVQQDPPFPPEMSPTSPLLSPQNSQSPLLHQAPPPDYQSPDMKSWQQAGLGSLFGQSEQSAGGGPAFAQQGVYNNMSITVSMGGASAGGAPGPPVGQAVGLGGGASVCSDQQVQQVQVFADVQCTVNLVGGDSYLNQAPLAPPQKGPGPPGPPSSQAQQKSLLQQLLTE